MPTILTMGPRAFTGTPRPRRRWHHAATDLDDFAIVSFAVDPEALARQLPPGFTPLVVDLPGSPSALVSAVAFVDRDFHFRFFPFIGIDCGQINYRAYVTYDGSPGVWFFGTALDHLAAEVPRRLWRMPWHRERILIDAAWGDTARWRLDADTAQCEAVEAGKPADLAGFDSQVEWLEQLTHPTAGWYRRTDGGIGAYSVWHPVMEPRHLVATSADFPVFERLGLITHDARPHSVLAQQRIPFDVHTPPRRVRPGRR